MRILVEATRRTSIEKSEAIPIELSRVEILGFVTVFII